MFNYRRVLYTTDRAKDNIKLCETDRILSSVDNIFIKKNEICIISLAAYCKMFRNGNLQHTFTESIVSTPPAPITRMSSKMVEMIGGNINGDPDGKNNMKIWRQLFEIL